MTEKELHKLKRQDILHLLLLQVREAEQMRQQMAETEEELQAANKTVERLKNRLDEKDEQIERLKDRLNEKDAQLARLKEMVEREAES